MASFDSSCHHDHEKYKICLLGYKLSEVMRLFFPWHHLQRNKKKKQPSEA